MSVRPTSGSGYAAIQEQFITIDGTPIKGTLSVNMLNEVQFSGRDIEPTLAVTISGSTDKFCRRELNCFLVRSNDEVIQNGIQTLDFGVGQEGKKFMAQVKLNVAADTQEKYRLKIELSGADPIYTNWFVVK